MRQQVSWNEWIKELINQNRQMLVIWVPLSFGIGLLFGLKGLGILAILFALLQIIL